MTSKASLRIGTSGYHYTHWKKVFYPEGLAKTRWLSYYAERFDTLELNNTFYHLPSSAAFHHWRAQVPGDFCFAVKFNRYGTHFLRLKKSRATIGKFIAAATNLGNSLGPILVQLPPRWDVDLPRLDQFLAATPREFRWAVEFRDARWLCPEVFEILRHHRAALCVHDMLRNHPRMVTTSWTYLRFHGNRYGGSYSRRRLASQAKWLSRQLAGGIDVFVYFNNDAKGYALQNAAELKRQMKI